MQTLKYDIRLIDTEAEQLIILILDPPFQLHAAIPHCPST